MAENVKKCPFCGEEIRAEAVKCKHCGEFLGERPQGMPPPPPAQGRGAGSMVACFIVAAVVVLIVAVIVVGMAAAIFMPALANAREKARKVKCMANLRQIGLGLTMYANDFGDHLPPDLPLLYPQYIATPQAFVCPSTASSPTAVATAPGTAFPSSYVYIDPGLPLDKIATPASTTILCYDKTGNHPDGANVLYLDGHVAWQKGFTAPTQAPKQKHDGESP